MGDRESLLLRHVRLSTRALYLRSKRDGHLNELRMIKNFCSDASHTVSCVPFLCVTAVFCSLYSRSFSVTTTVDDVVPFNFFLPPASYVHRCLIILMICIINS